MNSVPGDRELPLMEHIKELRSRMMVVIAVLIITLFLVFPITGGLINIIWNDLVPGDAGMVVYTPLEWMITRLMLSLAVSAVFVIPLIFYELYKFMVKGLYSGEKVFYIKIVPTSFLLFLIGAGIAYFIVIPVILDYLILYSEDVAASGLSVKQTFSMISSMIIGFGILFQLPMLVVFLIRFGLISQQQLRDKRILVYGILIALALFVAPDISGISQLVMALFLVILFELSLFIGRFVQS